MKKLLLTTIILFFLLMSISCGKGISKNYLQVDNFKTPLNHKIKFKKIGDKAYLQWYCDGELRTYDEPFDLKGADAWLPKFMAENNDYILLKAGCGSPCWNGFFLPLKKSLKLKVIGEYLAFDLHQNYVAKVNYDTDQIEVENIITSKTQSVATEVCEAVTKAVCIDTIYFEPKKIVTKWFRENDKPNIISEQLKI